MSIGVRKRIKERAQRSVGKRKSKIVFSLVAANASKTSSFRFSKPTNETHQNQTKMHFDRKQVN